MGHALIVEWADPAMRLEIEKKFEPMGHDLREKIDPRYKARTWGRRPEDMAAAKGLVADMTGQREAPVP